MTTLSCLFELRDEGIPSGKTLLLLFPFRYSPLPPLTLSSFLLAFSFRFGNLSLNGVFG